ncbi:hypothetical protein J4Q44_G00013340 [Coregonus suidteri]|uniref:Uncharacterized protein n=1 Tax=Coregonus suidteri TaxID=861788 RepID=A0AAN8NK04_9TELE
MASIDVSTSEDGPVNGHTSWACKSQERQLSDILLPVQSSDNTDISQIDRDTPNGCVPVLLEQVEEGSPCVITLCCAPHCPALITSLLVTSEARTIEVYSQAGDYCGTCRGERDPNAQPDSAERGPFYRNHLILESPTTSCEVKLLSLGGRGSVAVARVVMGLQTMTSADCSLSLGPSIDMLRVQSMMEEMGTSLSPGAQSLMNMVQFQQKNKADSLSGFLPFLLGSGALSALAKGTNGPSEATADIQQPSVNTSFQPDKMSDSASSDPCPQSRAASNTHTSLADMMSPFLNGQPGGRRPCIGPDMLPMLQSVCGQVTQLRIEDASKTSSGPRQEHVCCRELEQVMERRLGQMERRLMEHMDQRLDALQLRLETALLQTLDLPLSHLKTTAPMLDQPQALH